MNTVLHGWFSWMPDGLENVIVWILHLFTGKGWHLTLGIMFMMIVIFLPGGLMEGISRIGKWWKHRNAKNNNTSHTSSTPAE